jgi:hypothetical protein
VVVLIYWLIPSCSLECWVFRWDHDWERAALATLRTIKNSELTDDKLYVLQLANCDELFEWFMWASRRSVGFLSCGAH